MTHTHGGTDHDAAISVNTEASRLIHTSATWQGPLALDIVSQGCLSPPPLLNHGRRHKRWFDNVAAAKENTLPILDILEKGGSVAGHETTDPDRE